MYNYGTTYLPSRVATHAPLLKRWNGGRLGQPRSQHTPQHLWHPLVNPENLSFKLTTHTSCRGVMGPSHCALKLAELAEGDTRHRRGEEHSLCNNVQKHSALLLSTLKRRHVAEKLLQEAQIENMEWEKRFWLNTLLHRREAASAAKMGVSAREHAAMAAAGGGGGGGGGMGSVESLRSVRSFVAARQPLDSAASSAAGSVTSRGTFLPAEKRPRSQALTQSQRGALKVHSRTIVWEKVQQDGHNPPRPQPLCPPTRSSSLPPRVSSGALVSVLHPGALAALQADAESPFHPPLTGGWGGR
jgi:hypothetical protein